jgi:hypothetical protein
MIADPGFTPLTIPVAGTTVATTVLLLLHVPPLEPSLKITVCPMQTAGPPVIGAGSGFTVNVLVTEQPNLV